MADESVKSVVSFVVEVSAPNNNSVLWPHPRLLLRGAFNRERLRGLSATDSPINDMPNIPGMYIQVDGPSQQVAVYDPLSLKTSEKLAEKVFKIYKEVFKKETKAAESVRYRCTPHEFKEWCYWSRRLLDGGCLAIRRGNIPSMEMIAKMPGTLQANHFDRGQDVDRERKAPARYIPVMAHEAVNLEPVSFFLDDSDQSAI